MVLRLKARESRSLPGLPIRTSQRTISAGPPPFAGWSSPVARQAHNLKVTGSNPVPATNLPARSIVDVRCDARPPWRGRAESAWAWLSSAQNEILCRGQHAAFWRPSCWCRFRRVKRCSTNRYYSDAAVPDLEITRRLSRCVPRRSILAPRSSGPRCRGTRWWSRPPARRPRPRGRPGQPRVRTAGWGKPAQDDPPGDHVPAR